MNAHHSYVLFLPLVSKPSEPGIESEEDLDNVEMKPRAKFLSLELKRNLICEFYHSTLSLSKFMKNKGLERNRKSFQRTWNNSGLQELKDNSVPLTDALSKYDSFIQGANQKLAERNSKNASNQKLLPSEFESFISVLIEQMALIGKGLGRNKVKSLIEGCLREYKIGDSRTAFSQKTYERFLKKYDYTCKNVKNIDPARAAQVTPKNREMIFANLDSLVALTHEVDPQNCPWTRWEEVPARFKYNMDEMGTDPTQHRNKIVLPRWIVERLFQTTPQGNVVKLFIFEYFSETNICAANFLLLIGDKMYSHITLVVFSRADGLYLDTEENIDGCPMPMLIHTNPNMSSEAKTGRPLRLDLYHEDENTMIELDPKYCEGISEANPLHITIRTHKSGSMNKNLFFDSMIHFTKQLPKDQGKDGRFCFLTMDAHVSRWHPKALVWLFENRVIPYFFPSHLSIHVQPQDGGVISKVHKCIDQSESRTRFMENSSTIALLNSTIEWALTNFRNEENELIKSRTTNATTRAWGFMTGLEPANQQSQGWRDALKTFGHLNAIKFNNKKKDMYGAFVRAERPVITNDELCLLNDAVKNTAQNEVSEFVVFKRPNRVSCLM